MDDISGKYSDDRNQRRFQWLRIKARMKEFEVTRFMWFLRPRN